MQQVPRLPLEIVGIQIQIRRPFGSIYFDVDWAALLNSQCGAAQFTGEDQTVFVRQGQFELQVTARLYQPRIGVLHAGGSRLESRSIVGLEREVSRRFRLSHRKV